MNRRNMIQAVLSLPLLKLLPWSPPAVRDGVNSLSSSVSGYYTGMLMKFSDRNGRTVGIRTITDYDGSTKCATLWDSVPDGTDTFEVLNPKYQTS